jgi:microcystin-dependent protein
MTETYVGQIMMTGFNFAQKNFALCNGQLLSIQQNTALFSLLGVTYGGNGTQTFALPNMQGRVPAGYGQSVDPAWQPSPYALGEIAGTENVTLISSQMPMHNHQLNAVTTAGNTRAIGNAGLGASSTSTVPTYGPAGSGATPLYPATLAMQGGNTPHENMQPFRVINFNICLSGIYPSRN